jgi:AbiTii
MTPLVLKLQQAALDKNTTVSDLLRFALLVARKLAVSDLQKWIENELNGYSSAKDVPPYRKLRGTLRALNQYRGWEDVGFGSNELADKFSVRPVMESASTLEALLKDLPADTQLSVTYPAETVNSLTKAMGFGWSQPTLVISPANMASILDKAKTNILNWTMSLEEAGVLGEGLTFTGEEKSKAVEASAPTVYNATHMTVVQNMQQSQIQQSSPGATQTYTARPIDVGKLVDFISEVRVYAKSLKLADADNQQLSSDLATLEAQAKAPTPSKGIVGEAIASTRKILESAAGSLTAANLPILLQKAAALLS